MEIKFSFVDILSLIALILGLLYNFQILTLKNRTKAIRFFSFYLSNLTFIILFYFLLRLELDKYIKYFTPLLVFSVLLMPINLWVYLKKITLPNEQISYKKHFIFPIISCSIILILLLLGIFFKNQEFRIIIINSLTTYVLILMTIGFLILNGIYLSFAILLLKRHQKNIRNFYSYTQKVDLHWVKVMIYGYLFLLAGLITCELVKGDISDVIFYGVLIAYIIYTGHNALKQKEILYRDINTLGEIEVEEISETESYSDFQLNLFKELKVKLDEFILKEKPFLDQDLSIVKLAKDLNTNSKYLSHVINSEYKQNFINFINKFRVEEVKIYLLSEKQNLTIEALAQNAGFKSKSSFNLAFKKVTGKTPSDFIKEKKLNQINP
jgi:AraC-like DNA-binding protein